MAWATALVVGALVANSSAAAERARQEWGPTRPVIVATRSLEAGAAIEPEAFEVVDWPIRLVPDGAVRSMPATGRIAVDLAPGEVLAGHRLAGSGVGRTGAALAEHQAAVSVPLGQPSAPIEPGDLVDLYAPSGSGDELHGVASIDVRPAATRARVLSVRSDGATLIVARKDAAATAAAALSGLVSIVVVG